MSKANDEYKVYEKSISSVLELSEKYMLLDEKLCGKTPNEILNNEDVWKDDMFLYKESLKGSAISVMQCSSNLQLP